MWTCFWIERNGLAFRYLVTASAEECSINGYRHIASLAIENGSLVESTQEGSYPQTIDGIDEQNRWPTHCACGYIFTEKDNRKIQQIPMYTSADMTIRTTLKDSPIGAMWDSSWLPFWRNPSDGLCLTVKLPDGQQWHVDGPDAHDHKAWTRTGKPPLITVRPSILTPAYHGWLTDGVLSDDLDGRTYKE